jgi:fructose-bisphosphate aldolase class II
MPLVSAKDMLQDALRNGYAIGAFSVDHIDSIDAVLRTAEELGSPVMIQTGQPTLRHTKMSYLAAVARQAAEETNVPVALHLDHGTGFAQAIQAIRCGYTSLMFDGSRLELEQNIAITKRIKEAADPLGLPVEGELGVLGTRGKDEFYELTSPDEAELFVRETNVDSLAVALGNIHAAYGEKVAINLDHLKTIHDRVGVPIVLHGGTGISDDDIKRAIKLGVSKVNIATEWRRATLDHLRKRLSDETCNDFFGLIPEVREVIASIVRKKIELFGSAGKA